MNKLKAKLKKDGGFTLIEMLIVVAIIAILVAISIPMINSSLERAREATDAANERAAVGMAMVEVLSTNTLGGVNVATADTTVAYYKVDDSKGTLVKATDKGTDATFTYGKGTAAGDLPDDNAGKCVEVTYTKATGDFTTDWK